MFLEAPYIKKLSPSISNDLKASTITPVVFVGSFSFDDFNLFYRFNWFYFYLDMTVFFLL